jgi:hypothetical protein
MTLESARLRLPLLAAGQAQKEITHNEALALIDAGISAAVEAMEVDTPPAAPQTGQCWIVGPAPSGAWAGNAETVAIRTEGGWRFLPPVTGMQAWVKDQQLWAVREAAGWVAGAVRAQKLMVGGQQVVGAREPAVAAPSGGGTIDAEARAAIALLIERLAAHGLIEP